VTPPAFMPVGTSTFRYLKGPVETSRGFAARSS
jgi:hypothetical protein